MAGRGTGTSAPWTRNAMIIWAAGAAAAVKEGAMYRACGTV